MTAGHRSKPLDKSEIIKKTLALLKKQYNVKLARVDRPVLETLLYAICLENATVTDADAAYARLHNDFFDLNEVRVSSILELQQVFAGMPHSEWKAVRIRNVLHYVFENFYSFDFETLRRKGLDIAQKTLQKIKDLSPFVKLYSQQNSLDSHAIPIDDRMHKSLVWLSVLEPSQPVSKAAEPLMRTIKKAETHEFCHFFRCLACDPKFTPAFAAGYTADEDGKPDHPIERLTDLLKNGSAAFVKREEALKKKKAARAEAAPRTGKGSTKTAEPASKVSAKSKPTTESKSKPAPANRSATNGRATASAAKSSTRATAAKSTAASTKTAKRKTK